MGLFLFSLLTVVVGVAVLLVPNLIPNAKGSRVGGVIAILVGGLLLTASMVTVIDAGEVGVVVILGRVQPKPILNGVHLVLPYATIYKYPIRLREYSLIGNQSVEARVQNGLAVKIDTTTLYAIDPKMAGIVYTKVAKTIDVLEARILMPIIRSEIRNIASQYSADELYSLKRDEISKKIEVSIRSNVQAKGVLIDRFMIRKINLPEQVDKMIQLKNSAKQEAEAMKYKKQKEQQEAEIKVIEAQGLAKAQRIINSTLSPNYLQHEAIQAYKVLANSPNATFVILPTSPNATGIPLILNGTK